MLNGIQIRRPATFSVPLVATIGAIAYLLYVVFLVIQAFSNPKLENSLALEQEQSAQEVQETRRLDFMAIKDWHLFGAAETTETQHAGINEIPQETQLQFKLLGVFFLPNQKITSYAIVETDDHLQKKYRPGDAMPGGVTLESIAKYQVIILRNNQRESLSMGRDKTNLLAKT
jgi:type II secretory pathway component PulC